MVALAALALAGCQPAVTGPHDTVFVSDEKLDLLHLVDGATGEVTGTIRTGARPRGLELSPDGKLLYVAAGNRPRAVLFLRGGREAWVSSEQRGTISVFDPATRKIVATIDLVQLLPQFATVQAVEMAITRDGKRAFVALGRGNHVAEIDPQ